MEIERYLCPDEFEQASSIFDRLAFHEVSTHFQNMQLYLELLVVRWRKFDGWSNRHSNARKCLGIWKQDYPINLSLSFLTAFDTIEEVMQRRNQYNTKEVAMEAIHTDELEELHWIHIHQEDICTVMCV